jgi:nitrogen fixation protein NifQ
MTDYSDTIRQWAADDRRAGTLHDADGIGEVGLGAGEAGRRLAVRFALRVHECRVATVRYQVFGCGFTIAACAAAAALAEGRTLQEVAAIAPAEVDATLAGLPPARDYCAYLAVAALQAAVKSVQTRHPVQATLPTDDDEHAPRVTAADPLYRLLFDSPAPAGIASADRHLFACLLTVAASSSCDLSEGLGLDKAELAALLDHYFPTVAPAWLAPPPAAPAATCPEADAGIITLLSEHLPIDANGRTPLASRWLVRILATRAAYPGHLWRAMGLFARPELTAAIRRHLPALAAANNQGMRWKRFLFKQLCERNGGTMCKSPDCGVCSDYALCFGGE